MDWKEQAAIENEETDAVKIMTVHKAKGLEFPIVLVGDTSWSQKDSAEPLLFEKNEHRICFTLYCKDEAQSCETFLSRLMEDERDRDIEEEKRSLYVATTRASDMLVLTLKGQKGRNKQPWRDKILGNLLEIDEAGVQLAPGFEHLVEVVTASGVETVTISAPSAKACLETKYIEPVTSETFKEYVSPTAINEASTLDWGYDIEEDETSDDADRDKSQTLGLIAHKIMEAVGKGCGLEDLCGENSHLHQDLMGIEEAEFKGVLKHLRLLKDHPLVTEIESALEFKNEYQIVKPFDKFILSGRPDRVIKTPEGWKILDFKYSGSERHNEANEFQMMFYLYLVREIFYPLLGSELFYLKDGVSKKVQLDDEEVRDFENVLFRRIEDYQENN